VYYCEITACCITSTQSYKTTYHIQPTYVHKYAEVTESFTRPLTIKYYFFHLYTVSALVHYSSVTDHSPWCIKEQPGSTSFVINVMHLVSVFHFYTTFTPWTHVLFVTSTENTVAFALLDFTSILWWDYMGYVQLLCLGWQHHSSHCDTIIHSFHFLLDISCHCMHIPQAFPTFISRLSHVFEVKIIFLSKCIFHLLIFN
jgi:hypothetical protein